MELMICNKMQEVTKIKPHKLTKLLEDALKINTPILVYGTSGEGKSSIIRQFAKDHDMDLVVINLALDVPETIGGVPYAVAMDEIRKGKEDTATDEEKKTAKKLARKAVEYFTKLLNVQLEPLFVDNGRKKLLFLDEINQALQEVMNCLYSICDVDPEQRNWAGRPLKDVYVIAAGNKDDGSDGTVYLNPLPTPLHNRFDIYELTTDREDTRNYLKGKYKNIPQVVKYIDVLLDNEIPPRDIEGILKKIAFNVDTASLECKIGPALTIKLMDIQKKVKSVDPAQVLKQCRISYDIFKTDKVVRWASEVIEDEEELLDKFREVLSEEEVQSIVKGYAEKEVK